MNKGILFLLLINTIFFAFSQKNDPPPGKSKITGKVLDVTSKQALEYASISILNSADGKIVKEGSSAKTGNFSVDELPAGLYKMQVAFIGYESKLLDSIVVSGKPESFPLGEILLAKSSKTLQGITVTAGKLVENKIDKLVYNAEKDITAQTGVATDILRKVPLVSVDVNGNVELAGSSSIRFLINGKPSTAFGNNIADVLQAIPASQIKSIEVITNPGAKYDAQGLGGIINIILKKSNVQGINSSLSLSAGTRNENGSFNFNARKGKFGINAFLSGNLRPRAETPFTSERISIDTITPSYFSIAQDGSSDIRRHGFQTGVGFDAALSKRDNLTGNVSYNNFGVDGHGNYDQTQLNGSSSASDSLYQTLTRNNNSNSFTERNIDAGLNYKHSFKKEDQELEMGLNTSFGKNRNTAANEQYLLPSDSLSYGRNGENHGNEHYTEFTADYVQPFGKKIKWGIGTKLSVYDIESNSDILSYNHSTKGYLYDSSLSLSMNYNQKVYAGYTELSFPVGKLFDAKIGARYEQTVIHSFYSNADPQIEAPPYGTFVPSVFLSKALGEKQTLKLSYSKRIERPDYGDLNPFVNTSDPHNITMGNPYLKPEIGHRIEFSYTRNLGKSGSFTTMLFYRINNDDIQPFVVYYPTFTVGDSTYNNVYVTTRQNIGIERNSGVSLFGDLKPTSKLTVRANVFAFYRRTTNKIDSGYDSHSLNYRLNAGFTYQFTSTWVAEFFGNFNSARNEAQGKYPSFTSYSVAVRKQFWNKKASLALTANNFFNEYVTQETQLFGPGFTATTTRKIPFRSIGLNFTWKFGRLEFKKEPEENSAGGNAPTEQ